MTQRLPSLRKNIGCISFAILFLWTSLCNLCLGQEVTVEVPTALELVGSRPIRWCKNRAFIKVNCSGCDADECVLGPKGGSTRVADEAGLSSGSYTIDNITLNYHHVAKDYQVGGGQGCGSCGGGNALSSLSNLKIERRHRYRNMVEAGAFGPGVFCNYDITITLYQLNGGLQLDLFDPREMYSFRLVDGLSGDTLDGQFVDVRNKAVRSAELLDADGLRTTELASGKTIKVTAYNGTALTFEVIQLASEPNPVYAARLTTIADRNGYRTQLTYHYNPGVDDDDIAISPDRQWQINTVTDPYGRSANFHYKAQQVAGRWVVEKIDLPNGQDIDYLYEDDLHLTRVEHADGTVSTIDYGAEATSQTTRITFDDASSSGTHRKQTAYLTNNFVVMGGNAETAELWNQSALMVRSVTNGSGELSYLNLNDPNSGNGNRMVIYEGANRLKHIDGEWEARFYGDNWNLSLSGDGQPILSGSMESTFAFSGYNGHPSAHGRKGTCAQLRDAQNRIYKYQYDSDTFPTQKTYSDETTEITTYNEFKQVVRYEDRLNRVTKMTYDARGNLLSRTVGILNTGTDQSPNDVNQVEYALTRYEYYPEGHTNQYLLRYAFDANGNRTEYLYNSNHFLVEIKEPDDTGSGYHTAGTFTYDAAGRLSTSTDAMGRTTTYAYDHRDRNVKTTYNDNSTEEYLYGAAGSGNENLIVAQKDRNGNITSFGYDTNGRRIQTVTGHDSVGSTGSILTGGYSVPSEIPASAAVTSCTFLAGTSLEKSCTTNGEKTEYVYDYRHRQIATTVYPRSGKSLTTGSQYLNNLLFSRTDAYGRKSFYGYRDSDSALIRTVQATRLNPSGEPSNFTQVMNLVRSGTPDTPDQNGDYLIADSVLDVAGQTVVSIDPRGVVDAMVYDSRGRSILSIESATTLDAYNSGPFDPTDDSQLHPLAAKTQTLYDANSNVIETRHPRYFDADDSAGYQQCSSKFTYTHRNLTKTATVAAGAPAYTAGSPTDVQVTMSYTYYNDGRQKSITDYRGNVSRTLWHQCCGRSQGSIDAAGHGKLINTDFYGNVTHTAFVKDLGSDVTTNANGLEIVATAHSPNNLRTLSETTTRFDSRHRVVARTVWLQPQGQIDPNDVPIAGGGQTGDPAVHDASGKPVGLTTRMFYDEDLTDGVGLDAGITVNKLDGSVSFTLDISSLTNELSSDGIQIGTNSDFDAVVTLNPEDEIGVSISDGAGRRVAQGILKQDGTLLTWSSILHDNIASIENFGDVLETSYIDALNHITKSRSDGAGRTLETEDAESHITKRTFDANGNVLKTRDANGVGQDCVYDYRNRQSSCTDTQGDTSSVTYDKNSNVVETTDAKSKKTTCKFDARDRRYECTDRINSITKSRYDQNSNVVSITDGENSTTAYEYDVRNLKTKTTYPDHVAGQTPGQINYGIVEHAYDALTRTIRITDQNGDTRTHNYDLASRLTSRDYRTRLNSPSGPITDRDTFEHDDASRQTKATSGRYNNVVTFTYDEAGRPKTETLSTGDKTYTTTRSYDSANRNVKLTYPNGSVVDRTYTARNQLEQVKWNTNVVHTRSYDDGSRLKTTTHGNGVTSTFNYRSDNLLASIATPAASGATNSVGNYSYAYDANKNKTAETITGTLSNYGFGANNSTVYDDENRLTAWKRSDGSLIVANRTICLRQLH